MGLGNDYSAFKLPDTYSEDKFLLTVLLGVLPGKKKREMVKAQFSLRRLAFLILGNSKISC